MGRHQLLSLGGRFRSQQFPAGVRHQPLQEMQQVPIVIHNQHRRMGRHLDSSESWRGYAGSRVRRDVHPDPRPGLPGGRHQGGQRLRKIAVNRAVQFPRAVLRTGPFAQQKLARFERHFDA